MMNYTRGKLHRKRIDELEGVHTRITALVGDEVERDDDAGSDSTASRLENGGGVDHNYDLSDEGEAYRRKSLTPIEYLSFFPPDEVAATDEPSSSGGDNTHKTAEGPGTGSTEGSFFRRLSLKSNSSFSLRQLAGMSGNNRLSVNKIACSPTNADND